MLMIDIPAIETFVEETNEFISTQHTVLQLEHSLVSLAKWESKWHKPFLGNAYKHEEKTDEEVLDYIRCMTVNRNVDENIYKHLPPDVIIKINEYIRDPMTATTVGSIDNSPRSRETVTSELIYYWMIKFGVPMECQKWHLNRLMKLIEVCIAKESPPQKMSDKQRAALNNARRAKYKTRG